MKALLTDPTETIRTAARSGERWLHGGPARVDATAAGVRTACCRFALHATCAAAGKWARAARLSRCKRVSPYPLPLGVGGRGLLS